MPDRRVIFDVLLPVKFIIFLGIFHFFSSHLTVSCFLLRVTLQLTLESGQAASSNLTWGPATSREAVVEDCQSAIYLSCVCKAECECELELLWWWWESRVGEFCSARWRRKQSYNVCYFQALATFICRKVLGRGWRTYRCRFNLI